MGTPKGGKVKPMIQIYVTQFEGLESETLGNWNRITKGTCECKLAEVRLKDTNGEALQQCTGDKLRVLNHGLGEEINSLNVCI